MPGLWKQDRLATIGLFGGEADCREHPLGQFPGLPGDRLAASDVLRRRHVREQHDFGGIRAPDRQNAPANWPSPGEATGCRLASSRNSRQICRELGEPAQAAGVT